MTGSVKKELVVTDTAKSDLRNIRQYIAIDSPHNARVFAAELAAKIEWIAEIDFTSSPRDHIKKGLRGFPYRNRCIYYRSYSDRIVVVRVLHSAQDVTQQDFEER
jgi:toxin ParE1/3/4